MFASRGEIDNLLQMPTFVPVTDSEKAKSEQSYYGKELLQHRRFDDPHSVIRTEDSTEKDDCAQYLKHAEGQNKMVKNERGLWVKASTIGHSETSEQSRGAGRGSGIPVIEQQKMSYTRESRSSDDIDIESKNYKDSSRRRSDSRDRRGRESEREKEKPNRKKRDRSGSNSSWSDVERYKRRPKREDSRDRHHKRHDSRDRYKRESSRDRGYSKRDRDRRSGSRERKSKSKYDDRYYDDRRSSKDYEYELSKESKKSKYRDDRDHRNSYDNDDNHRRKKDYSEDYDTVQSESLMEVEDPSAIEEPIQITAIQVVNHFHEVFEMNMRNQSDEGSRRRLTNIKQLFHDQCSIRSLRHVDKAYLTGKEAIEESFERTLPQKIVPSKRIFIESALFSKSNFDQVFLVGPSSAAQAKAYDENAMISYVVDFHRAGTSPGLGDLRKDTILLYECQQQYVMNIWVRFCFSKCSACFCLIFSVFLGNE